MDWLRIFASRIRGLFVKKQSEQELDSEVREHLDHLTNENLQRGMSEPEARAAARRSFGGVEQTKELYRDQRGLPWLDTLFQDFRFGSRMLRKNPGFTAAAVLTLALGIGASTAIFSIVNAVLMRPLSFREPEQLAVVWQNNSRQHIARGRVTPANFLDWQERTRAFSEMSAITYWSFDYTGTGDPESLLGEFVTKAFFGVLGVQAQYGRVFLPEEFEAGRDKVIVISHGLWERRFASDPGVIHQIISLSNHTYTIVGVLPVDFTLPWIGRDREVFAPYVFNNEERQVRSGGYLQVLGRLKPGIPWEQAQADISSIAEQLAHQYPSDDAGVGATIVPLTEQVVGKVRPMLELLLGAVVFVLLIGCANVANLLLARGSSRQRELAIRAALGANRRRLLRQLFVESSLLALVGCAGGLLLARWCDRLFLSLAGDQIPRISSAAMDLSVVLFAVGSAFATALLFGLAPALQVLRTGLQSTLKDGAKSAAPSSARHRLRSTLVVTEVALSLMLLAGAGLLVRSFYNVLQVKLGFVSDHLVTLDAYIWSKYARPEQRAAYVQQALQNISSLSGVEAAGVSSSPPLLLGGGGIPTAIRIIGQAAIREDQKPAALMNIATPGYFPAMRISLLRGRLFNDFDRADSAPVVLINQAMAQRFWAEKDPVGTKIVVPRVSGDFNAPPVECEIVGIVGDVRQTGPEREAEAEFYRPHIQDPTGSVAFLVRTRTDPSAALKSVETAIWQANKTIPFYVATTMDDLLSSQFQQRYFSLALLGGFALLALTLSAIGIYGVISYSTSQRTQEMGIRMALGAQTSDVLRLVIRQAMFLVLTGVALGIAGSLALKQLLSGFLFGVSANDPITLVGVAAILSAVALLACYIPARRATRIDPLLALRYE
jgi:predicted permease